MPIYDDSYLNNEELRKEAGAEWFYWFFPHDIAINKIKKVCEFEYRQLTEAGQKEQFDAFLEDEISKSRRAFFVFLLLGLALGGLFVYAVLSPAILATIIGFVANLGIGSFLGGISIGAVVSLIGSYVISVFRYLVKGHLDNWLELASYKEAVLDLYAPGKTLAEPSSKTHLYNDLFHEEGRRQYFGGEWFSWFYPADVDNEKLKNCVAQEFDYLTRGQQQGVKDFLGRNITKSKVALALFFVLGVSILGLLTYAIWSPAVLAWLAVIIAKSGISAFLAGISVGSIITMAATYMVSIFKDLVWGHWSNLSVLNSCNKVIEQETYSKKATIQVRQVDSKEEKQPTEELSGAKPPLTRTVRVSRSVDDVPKITAGTTSHRGI